MFVMLSNWLEMASSEGGLCGDFVDELVILESGDQDALEALSSSGEPTWLQMVEVCSPQGWLFAEVEMTVEVQVCP